jgi:hypothetical protein
LTSYLNSEMATALFGVSDHHFPSLNSRGKASQDDSQLAITTTPYLSAGFPSQVPPVSAVSLLAEDKSICCLRLDLIEMLRISLHAVDYATKAYALGSVEFALHAHKGRKKLEYLSQTIIAASRDLDEAEFDDPQLDFIEAAHAISAALSAICRNAYELTSHTVALVHGGMHRSSKELVQSGERADRLLRLCIVAFMKQKVEYAEAVLRYIEEWRRSTGVSAMITNNAHEEPIATSLAQIMENLCTIAVASLLPYRFQC